MVEKTVTMAQRITVSFGAGLGSGGIGVSGYRLARGLLEAGARLHVICAGAEPGLLPDVRVDTIRDRIGNAMVRTPLRLWPGLPYAAANTYFDWRASKLVGETDIFYGYPDQALWTLRSARGKFGTSVLFAATSHIKNQAAELRAEARLQGAVQNWITPFTVWKVCREYQEADFVRVDCTLTRETLIAGGVLADKIVFAPPSVDLQRFRPSEAREGVFRVAFVGSFDLRKGIPYLLQAWDLAALPKSQLILHGGVGSRFMKRMLAPYANRPNVVFRSGDPVRTFAEASVLVLPSVEDGFANVVLEALASGCPVIVSENVGAKDAVVDGKNGYVVSARDPEAIARRLQELRASPRRLAEMRRAARVTAERYTFAAEASGLLNALSEAVSAKARLGVLPH